jgi:hypothetical protein
VIPVHGDDTFVIDRRAVWECAWTTPGAIVVQL